MPEHRMSISSGGPWLETDTAAINAEAVRLQKLVRARLLAGYYRQGTARFVPELSRVQLYQFRKAGVPGLLLGLANGDEPGAESDRG